MRTKIQQDNACDQPRDHAPDTKDRPGHDHSYTRKANDKMRASAICQFSGDWREEHADRTDDTEQAGNVCAEMVSGLEM
ncbi:MAG TPA: hypothetical protein VHC69_27910 [Polyangiaceae bacterium]|nr:hypothetical protein [Polyangiaceae bacterium]